MQDVKTRAMQAAIELYGTIPADGELAKPKGINGPKTRNKLVHGRGINDADYLTTIVVKIENTQCLIWQCPAYNVWQGMLRRAYSKEWHAKHPVYLGTTVCKEWHTFSKFREWFVAQDWRGKHLDKDILSPGLKIYSPGTCVFISQKLNNFFTDRKALRGEYPIGVCLVKACNKFIAYVRVNGRLKSLGRFTDPNEAHAAWLKAKYELAIKVAAEQTDKRLADAILNHPIFAEITSGHS